MSTTAKTVFVVLAAAAVALSAYRVGVAQGQQGVILPVGSMKWEPYAPGSPLQLVTLWGDRTKGEYGMLLKLPAGFEAGRHAHSADYHAVGVQGTWVHTTDADPSGRELPPGSYVREPGKQMHNDMCKGTAECIIFVHQHAAGDFIPGTP